MEARPIEASSYGSSLADDSPSRLDGRGLFQAVQAAEATIKQQAEENVRLRSELEQKILELENYRKHVSKKKGQKGFGNSTVAYDELEKGANDYGGDNKLQSWADESALPETEVIGIGAELNKDDTKERENHGLSRKVIILEWFFLTTNVFTELLSTVLEQLSSTRNPHFALMGLLLSFIGVCFCIIELILKCIHENVLWKCSRVPWFYQPSGKLFGSFRDVIGLVCAICQCIVTSINYEFYRRHADAPVKVSLWPLTFAFGLLCSRFLKPKVDPSHTD